jgi:alanyl-tRNA synthetase
VDALVQLQKPAKPVPAYSFSTDKLEAADLKTINSLFDAENAKQAEVLATLQDANKKLGKELAEAKKQAVLGDNKVEKEIVNGITFVAKAYNGLDPKELRLVAENFLKQAESGIAAVGTNVEGKGSVVVAVSKELSQKHSAVTLVQAAVAELGGKGGGGKPDMAQGGGPDGDKIEAAIAKIRANIN